MEGVGGPLLTIGDLLSDVGDSAGSGVASEHLFLHPHLTDAPLLTALSSSDLPMLFEDNFEELSKALAGTDHSWTALTLKLCTALETANKLVQSTNSEACSLSTRMLELGKIMDKRDMAITAAKIVQDDAATIVQDEPKEIGGSHTLKH